MDLIDWYSVTHLHAYAYILIIATLAFLPRYFQRILWKLNEIIFIVVRYRKNRTFSLHRTLAYSQTAAIHMLIQADIERIDIVS